MMSNKVASFAIFLMLCLNLFSPSHEVTEDTIQGICTLTQSLEFCENLLLSDPRTSCADPPKLSLISIELTRKQANETFHVLSQLHDSSTDPAIQAPLKECLGMYETIEGKIEHAYDLSLEKRYKDIVQLTQSYDLAMKCENGIPLTFNGTAVSSTNMILTSQTSTYVNMFVARSMELN